MLLNRLQNHRALNRKVMLGSLPPFRSARLSILASTLALSTLVPSQFGANSQLDHRLKATVVNKTTTVVTTSPTMVSHRATVVKITTTVVTASPTVVRPVTTVEGRTNKQRQVTGQVVCPSQVNLNILAR